MGFTAAADAGPLCRRVLAAMGLGACLVLGAVPAVAAEADPRFEIARYQVEGNTLLDGEVVEKAVAVHAGKSRTFADVEQARLALQQAYSNAGFGAVQVMLPEQELKQGVVRIQVLEARIVGVSVSGNRSFGVSNIRASIPGLREGTSPNTRRIAESLQVANENPAKQATMQMRTGARAGEIEVSLQVVDEKPWKAFATLDNTGRPETGRLRLGVGYQHANVGERDHILTLQYVTSPEKLSEVGIYGASYRIPLYSLGDTLDFFAGYSDVDSGTIADVFNVSGKGTVLGARYNQNLRKHDDFGHKLTYGLDHRAYRNNVDYQGTQLGNDVTVHPLSLGYSGQWRLPRTDSGVHVSFIHNIPGGSRGRDADFELARTGAKAGYNLWHYGFNVARTFADDWQVRAALDGQHADDLLIPGEQFGVGGMDSVRGFAEREISGDKGYRASVELYTPEFGARTGIPDTRARAVVFYDMGDASSNDPQPGDPDNRVASAGAGLRLGLGKPFSMRLDYAYVVDAGGGKARGHEQLHFSLAAVY